MYNYGSKLTKDQDLLKDVLQDLFTEFWVKRKGQSEVQNVKVYLVKSLRYKLLRTIEKDKINSTISIDSLLYHHEIPEELENEASNERKERLKLELQKLPERQKEILHLKYFQKLDNQQISEIANINYQSVSNLIHRAIFNLKKSVLILLGIYFNLN